MASPTLMEDGKISDLDADIENQYYNSKAQLEDNPPLVALDGFAAVVAMESDEGIWGFKALKQIVKLHFKLGNHAEMMLSYRKVLTYIRSAVTRNYGEKVINSILDAVSGSPDLALLQEFYETTLCALEEANNERLWFKTNPQTLQALVFAERLWSSWQNSQRALQILST